MKRYITFTIAAILTAGIAASAWSQAGQSGGAGTAGTAGAAGTAGTAGAAGTAGTANTPGTAGVAGAPGTPGVAAPGAAANANIGANPQGAGIGANPQRQGVGTNPVRREGIGANPQRRAAGFGNNNIRQTPFFTDPGVRQQLNLNENQFNTLNRAYQEAYGRFNRGVAGLSNNLTAQQRQAQYQEFANQFNNDFGRNLDQTLTDPRYRTRYDQLNRQYMGFSAFNSPAIQQQLNLTPQQMVQLRQLASVWRQQLMQLQGGSGATNANVNINPQQWNEMYTQYGQRLHAVLTPEQQQQWTQLTGQPYTFSPNLFLSGSTTTSNGVDVPARVQTNVTTPQPTNPAGIEAYGAGTQGAAGSNQNAPNSGQPAPQGSQPSSGQPAPQGDPPAGNQPAPQGSTSNSGTPDTQGGAVR